MYTLQAGNPEHVASMEDLDVEAQSITLPPKALQPSGHSHRVSQTSLPQASFFGNILHKFGTVAGPESSAGSDLNTRSSSPSNDPRSDASYSTPSVESDSRANSRSASLVSSSTGNQRYDVAASQQAVMAPEMIYSRDIGGYDFEFSSTEDEAASAFTPQLRKHRDLIAPKPWLDQSLPKTSAQDELSDDEVDQVSAAQVLQAPTAEYKASPTHHAGQDGLGPALDEWMDCVTTATPKARPEDTPKTRRRGRRTIVVQKHLMQAAIIGLK
ncbi:chitin synthase-domain-containing protein [Penicillium atrosanguineum]|nr:chitin synthase-domain-containing protein [Penicillium atrosanguineum]